jgi:hypothetical protein
MRSPAFLRPVLHVAADVRVACAAFVVALAVLALAPRDLTARNLCGPGSYPTTGCSCSNPPPSFEFCECCTNASGGPACLWCRID